MNKIRIPRFILQSFLLAGVISLSACNDSNPLPTPEPPPPPPPVAKIFTVEVINLTNNQPMSPLTLVSHEDGNMWQINQAASVALETMAEGGDNSLLLAEDYVDQGVSGGGILAPGAAETVSLETFLEETIYLSLATMLVNTNDAFAGFNQLDVTNLAVGDSVTQVFASYDAGTEANTEMPGTIPGPADGGEGFNAVRDDVDFVARHSGVVTADDGLTSSALNESHRFDNPVIRVAVVRTQ